MMRFWVVPLCYCNLKTLGYRFMDNIDKTHAHVFFNIMIEDRVTFIHGRMAISILDTAFLIASGSSQKKKGYFVMYDTIRGSGTTFLGGYCDQVHRLGNHCLPLRL